MEKPQKALDSKALSDLLSLDADVGGTLIPEMLEAFYSSVPALMDRLVKRSSVATIGQDAHALKSAVGNFGALYLAELLQELESSAKKNETAQFASQIQMIEVEFKRMMSELQLLKKAA